MVRSADPVTNHSLLLSNATHRTHLRTGRDTISYKDDVFLCRQHQVGQDLAMQETTHVQDAFSVYPCKADAANACRYRCLECDSGQSIEAVCKASLPA